MGECAKDMADKAEKAAGEKAERQAQEKAERAEKVRKARESMAEKKAVEDEFEKSLALDPEPLRRAANELMEANYGTCVKPEEIGRRGLPLHLMTRRKEVAWIWAGALQELIGGGQ